MNDRTRPLALSLLCLVTLVLFPGCHAKDVNRQLNVVYGEVAGQKLLLDLFHPASQGTAILPAIVFVHGGGWKGGDKQGFDQLAEGMARLGYVTFSINYRLVTSTGNRWPAQLDDTQRAVRWVRANSGKYGVDPTKIGALGASAGGHLAAFLGTTDTRDNSDAALASCSSRVACVVDLSGPTDLADDFAPKVKSGALVNDMIRNLLGGSPAEVPAVAKDASPLNRVDARSAPFLILHGRLDELVPPDHSERLNAALQKAGVESKLIMFDDEGHAFLKKQNLERFVTETREFFKRHLGK